MKKKDAVIRFLSRFWMEISFFLCAEAFLFFLAREIYRPSDFMPQRILSFALKLLSGIGMLLLLLRLWRKKWKKRWTAGCKKLFSRIGKTIRHYIGRLFEKLNLRGRGRYDRIGGTTVITFDEGERKKQKRHTGKLIRWKQTESDRERLRLLYRYMIRHKRKQGMHVSLSDTPLELRRREELADGEEALFDLYIKTRYDERVEPPAETVSKLKTDFEREWSIK